MVEEGEMMTCPNAGGRRFSGRRGDASKERYTQTAYVIPRDTLSCSSFLMSLACCRDTLNTLRPRPFALARVLSCGFVSAHIRTALLLKIDSFWPSGKLMPVVWLPTGYLCHIILVSASS